MHTMTQQSPIVGIDIAQASLDLFMPGQPRTMRFTNTPHGRASLLARLGPLNAPIIGLEPSGGYQAALLRDLLEHGFDARFADARRVRARATAHNAPAKTDAIDARFIARFIAETGGQKIECDPILEQLADILAARRTLLEQAQRLTQSAQARPPGRPRQMREDHARTERASADDLEQDARALLDQHPELARRAALLQTVPGVGPLVAMTLLAEVPELGRRSGKQIARLVGLAPFLRQSGATQAKATCQAGRAVPRQLLYLAAMAAKPSNPGFKDAFDRLAANGKPKMVALVAIMRKLATILNAILRDNTPWNPIHAAP
jgi:transposase